MSDIEGKAARVAASERGLRASFKVESRNTVSDCGLRQSPSEVKLVLSNLPEGNMKRFILSTACFFIALTHAAKSQDTSKTPSPQPKPKAARVHASRKQQQPSVERTPANVRLSYAEALRRYRRQRHNRVWWKQHFTAIVLVGGGYYYWDAGYWFPAWGYDPAYEYYDYDGPIYTYGNLLPDQVILNVQRALQEEGYYARGLTGSLGSATRQAIANYQQDAGLFVTGAIDAATVESLGLN
jgi:Putative peptidoglycan binding domain